MCAGAGHDRSDDDDQETEQELGVEKMRDCDGDDVASDGGHSLQGECWGPATASRHRIPSHHLSWHIMTRALKLLSFYINQFIPLVVH